jgi:hypothetical protein
MHNSGASRRGVVKLRLDLASLRAQRSNPFFLHAARWIASLHRTLQSATILDRVVSHVTVTDPRHSLFGSKLAVLPERSARGPTYIVVQLSDGRRRSIRVSSTDLGEPPIASDSKGSAVSRISLRTLIPLTRHLNASLALLAEEVIRDGPTHPSRTRCVSATPAPGMPAPPVGKKSSAPMVEVAGRDAKAGSPGSCRVDTANASRRRRIRKGDHPC